MPDAADNRTTYDKGVEGEARAEAYLCLKGMVPLRRRYHSPFGEIDLVLRDGDALVFVEVKARHSGRAYDGANAVGADKQKRIVQTARCYLAEHPQSCPVRFDVVEWTRDGLQHFKNAFEGREW